MKIALFTETFHEPNGVATTYQHLAKYCKKKGINLDIYTYSKTRTYIELDGSVRILYFKPLIPVQIYFDIIFDLPVLHLDVLSMADKIDYDIIQVASPGSMGMLGQMIAQKKEKPMVGIFHTAFEKNVRLRVEDVLEKRQLFPKSRQKVGEFSENVTWDYLKRFYLKCQLVLAPSRYTLDLIQKKFGLKKNRSGIFTRGIDTDFFSPEFKKEHKELVALYVGRVSVDKNLEMLDFFAKKKHVKLKIVGDGDSMADLKKKLPNAVFTGFVKGEKLRNIYASADFFVFPSVSDTFGNVVLEAMASGLPVVVTDKMGPKEMVKDGVNGFIADNKRDFKKKVDLLIKDQELRMSMGGNAREYTETRRWDSVFDDLIEKYSKLIESHVVKKS